MWWRLRGSCTRLDMNPLRLRDLDNRRCLIAAELAIDIDICQYKRMSKSLSLLAVADSAACCPPLAREPLSAEQAELVAPQLKALADPVRLRLMSLVASHPGGERWGGDRNGAFAPTQPRISHHLKVRHDGGLLDGERRGVWVYSRGRTQALASLGALIGDPPR